MDTQTLSLFENDSMLGTMREDLPLADKAGAGHFQSSTPVTVSDQATQPALPDQIGESPFPPSHIRQFSLIESDSPSEQTNGSQSLLQTSAATRDAHFNTACELSKALHEMSRRERFLEGHARRVPKGVSPQQVHRVGNAIFDHLLASLREQVKAETEVH